MLPTLGLVREPVKFGLIGAGRIAQTYAEAFQETELAKLVAIADVRKEAASVLAEPLRIAACSSSEELLATQEIDAVVIATPPSTHCVLSLFFLERGIPVLCEKPVSTTVKDAHAIREAAQSNGTLFTMASKFRYVDDVIRAKAILTSGILGQVVWFENTFSGRVDMSARWNARSSISGGGVLIDNGTHSVDIMRYFFGSLDEIFVTEAPRTQGLNVDETIQMNLRSRTGVLGTCQLSWSISQAKPHFIEIYGSEGALRVGWSESFFQQEGSSKWVRFGTGYEKVKAFKRQLDNFSGAIRGTDLLLITVDDAVASVEAIDAGYQALQNKSWTSIIRPAPATAQKIAI